MKMARFLLSMIVALTVWGHVAAQVVTTTPSVVTTESAPVIITFHADRGSKGLAGVGPSEAVYAHTGVISHLPQPHPPIGNTPPIGSIIRPNTVSNIPALTHGLSPSHRSRSIMA